MQALVNTATKIVVMVQASGFPVTAPLKWVACDGTVHPATHLWDGQKLVRAASLG